MAVPPPPPGIHSTVLFSISFCFYRACFTHLVSSNLSCNICFWYYDQLVHFNKDINANEYIVIVSGNILNVSTVHLNSIWHLIWHYLSKPVLGGHPVLSIPGGCPLISGFTVLQNEFVSLTTKHRRWSRKILEKRKDLLIMDLSR